MFKTAKIQILSYNNNISKSAFKKTANTEKYASHFDDVTESSSIIEDIKEKLSVVAGTYSISSNPNDYIYVAVRALTADIPNENWDAFAEKELLRFEPKYGCRVYQTFNLKPHHVNHRSQDPTQARGAILDSHYNTKNAEHFPEILVAIDKTKDKRLANGIASGEIEGWSMGCFEAGTPILMSNGTLKNIENINIGDEVITHKGNNKKVSFVMSRPHTGEIYEIKVDSVQKPFVVTEEHPLWMFDNNKQEFDWVEVRDLKEGDIVTCPTNAFSKNHSDIDMQKARLFGYYLAEGRVKFRDKERNIDAIYGIEFCINKDENDIKEEICSLINSVTKKEPTICVHNTCENALVINIYAPELAQEFYKWGLSGSKQKQLSEFVLNWSLYLKSKMLGAYFNGDGHQAQGRHSNGAIYVATASKLLANQVYHILLQLGVLAYLTEQKRKPTPNGYSVGLNTQYQIKVGKNYVNQFIDLTGFNGEKIQLKNKGSQRKFFFENYWCSPITSIKKIPYDNYVYNFEVEGDNSYIANGIAVHNCDAEYTTCNVCGKKANTPSEFCDHIKFYKGKDFEGKIAFEWCEGVTFVEESSVDDPADKNALTQETILASKNKELEQESEFLAINSKLNTILAKLDEGGTMGIEKTSDEIKPSDEANIEKTEPLKKLDKDKNDVLKQYKDKKDKEDEEQLSQEEFGAIVKTPEITSDVVKNKTSENNMKKAVDSDAKKYWKKYVKDYGDEAVKDVKPKKIGYIVTCYSTSGEPTDRIRVASYLEALQIGKKWKTKGGGYEIVSDKGQMFTKIDSPAGNAPKEFQIDRKKGNPPAEFKFAKVYKDIEIFSVSPKSKYWVIAKANTPLFVMLQPTEFSGTNKRNAMVEVLKSIAKKGLHTVMNQYKAHKLKSLYTPVYKPSIVEEFSGDIQDSKKFRTKPTKGIETQGVDDLETVDRSKVKEKSVDADGEKDMPLKHSMVKKGQELAELFTLIDAEEAKGTPDDQIIQIIDAWIAGKGKGGKKDTTEIKESAKMTPEAQEFISNKIKTLVEEGYVQDQAAAIAYDMARKQGYDVPEKTGKKDKKASITDRAIRDLSDAGKVQPEATKGSTSEGAHDLDKVKRDDTKADEVFASGKDDLDIKRDNVVNLKANKESIKAKLAKIVKEKLLKKAIEETVIKEQEAKFEDYKKAFRERLIRALHLAAKRANLNIIDNDLKLAIGDVLVSPTEDYIGMDGDLAMNLIEDGFLKGGDKYIESLLKEADKYIDLSEQSFLELEDDAKRINVIMPALPVSAKVANVNQTSSLAEEFSSNNPIITPKASSDNGSKWSHLKGIFDERLI